ncbi:MAG: methyltransferase domain-containing protein [Nitrospirales bacterium]|nr:class I SAM-dependent methyltransferase [Nitrospirales bacterium]
MDLLRTVCKTIITLIKKVRQSKSYKTLEIGFKTTLGIPVRYRSPARTILENSILPYFSTQSAGSKVLFVGCDWYTKHYNKDYFRHAEYWTIDPDTAKKRYGAKYHVSSKLELLDQHFRPEYFDVIICNGVLGYGLNNTRQAEQAFNCCYTCLQPSGKLVIGREDDRHFIPFSNEELKSLRQFHPYFLPPLATSKYRIGSGYNYSFNFYEKPPNF